MNSHMARAKLRRPTSVASVATNGGRRIDVISQVCSVPTRKPDENAAADRAAATPSVPTVTSAFIGRLGEQHHDQAQVVALKATIEPAERSMPPAMITTAAPEGEDAQERPCCGAMIDEAGLEIREVGVVAVDAGR